MATFRICLFLVAPAVAILIADIQKCQVGTADLAGDKKVFTIQVCNLFGDTCYMNQVETASADCATQALALDNLKCALFPIMTYANSDRSVAADLQVGGLGCSVSCSNTDCKFSGGCVSIQCKTGASTFVGVATTGSLSSSSARVTGVTDTTAQTFKEHQFAEISAAAKQIKTVFLTRTGDYVATASQGGQSSGTNTYSYGELPTGNGNNYGPVACPTSTDLSSAAVLTKDELRMCGPPGEWVYYNGVNLLMDTTMTVQASDNSASGTNTLATTKGWAIGDVPFLFGSSKYKQGTAMDDPRKLYLYEGTGTSGSILLTSDTITPAKSEDMALSATRSDPDIAGIYRSYTVVFYCDDYDRQDLTTCAEANRKMFYCADPNPTAQFGITPGGVGGGSNAGSTTTSGSVRATMGLLGFVATLAWASQA